MAKYVGSFKAWALRWYNKFLTDKKTNHNLFAVSAPPFSNGRYTIVGNLKTGKTATAKCHSYETYSIDMGIGVAYARYCDEEIPKERRAVPMHTLKNGDRFISTSTEIEGVYIGFDSLADKCVWRNGTNATFYGSKLNSSDRDTLVYIVT